jgi:DHA3 family tetracycline resistance protein-like MFS transporter
VTRRIEAGAAYLLYMGWEGFSMRLAFTIFTVFAVVRLGLDPLQLVLLGTVLEATYLVFEVPTGVVADTYGRRISVIVGAIGTGLAFLLLAVSTSFLLAAVSQALWGAAATFMSGADVAWLTDEVGEDRAPSYYVRGDKVWHAAALAGIVASVALASIDLRLPIAMTGVGMVALGATLAVVMPQERFARPERAEGERARHGIVRTFREGVAAVRAHHVMLLIVATAALHGASTEAFDRLADFHVLVEVGLPPLGGLDRIAWFGVLDGVGLLAGLVAIAVVERKLVLRGHARVARFLAAIDVVLVAGVAVFALTRSFALALAAFWLVGGLRSAREPIFTAWLNEGLDPRTRATVNSFGTQSDAVGQAVGGPALGAIGNRSVPLALVASAVLRLPTLVLYARAARRDRALAADLGATTEVSRPPAP